MYSLQNPNVVYTAEQVGKMHRVDLRSKVVSMVFENRTARAINSSEDTIPLKYMIQHPDLGEHYIIYSNEYSLVAMMDIRYTKESRDVSGKIRAWDPHYPPPYDDINYSTERECRPFEGDLFEMEASNQNKKYIQVSGMSFSNDGRQFLVNYQHDQIYSFRTHEMKIDVNSTLGFPVEGAVAVYGGHVNCDTFLKNVSYFGPRNEYVVAGSDSGHMWIWDAKAGYRGLIRPEYSLLRTAEVVALLKTGKIVTMLKPIIYMIVFNI